MCVVAEDADGLHGGAAHARIRIFGAAHDRRAGRGQCAAARPASMRTWRFLPVAAGRRARRSASTSLPGSRASARQGGLRQFGIAIGGGIQQHGHAGDVAQAVEHADGREAQLLRAAAGGFENGGQDGRIAAVGQGQQQEGLPVRAAPAQLGGQRLGHLAAGKLAGRAQADAEQGLVRRAQLLEQQRHAGRLPGEDRPADRLEHASAWARPPCGRCRTASRLRRVCPAARNRSAQRMQPSATAGRTAAGAAARDWLRALAAWSPPMRPRATAAAEATSASASLSFLHEAADRLRVAADADRVDDADEQPALQLAHGARAGRRPPPDRESPPGRSAPRRPAPGPATSGASAGTASLVP